MMRIRTIEEYAGFTGSVMVMAEKKLWLEIYAELKALYGFNDRDMNVFMEFNNFFTHLRSNKSVTQIARHNNISNCRVVQINKKVYEAFLQIYTSKVK